jgi:hypothetical protein
MYAVPTFSDNDLMRHGFFMLFSGLDLNSNRCICKPVMTSIAAAADEPGKLVFAQIMEHLPLTTFRRCVARYDGEPRRRWTGSLA